MRYKLCLIEKTLLYHKADNSEIIYKNDINQQTLLFAQFQQ